MLGALRIFCLGIIHILLILYDVIREKGFMEILGVEG
jgi:hypothetical protein